MCIVTTPHPPTFSLWCCLSSTHPPTHQGCTRTTNTNWRRLHPNDLSILRTEAWVQRVWRVWWVAWVPLATEKRRGGERDGDLCDDSGFFFFFKILWPDTQPLRPRRRFPTPSPKFGCVQRASLGSNPGLKHFIQTLRLMQVLSYSSWFSDVHQTRACKRPTWKRSTYRSCTLPLALELHARQQHGWSWRRRLGRHLLHVQLHWRQCRDRGWCCATDSRH